MRVERHGVKYIFFTDKSMVARQGQIKNTKGLGAKPKQRPPQNDYAILHIYHLGKHGDNLNTKHARLLTHS